MGDLVSRWGLTVGMRRFVRPEEMTMGSKHSDHLGMLMGDISLGSSPSLSRALSSLDEPIPRSPVAVGLWQPSRGP